MSYPESEYELEQKLENIYSAALDTLRGNWNGQQANHLLLSLLFYKRLIALLEEHKIQFVQLDNELLQQHIHSRHSDQVNPQETLALFNQTLEQFAPQHKVLEHFFVPLCAALQQREYVNELWQVLQLLDEVDFSSRQFPTPVFGKFFNLILHRSAVRAGKVGGDVTTPYFINKLLTTLANPQRNEQIYDATAGQGSTLIELYQQCSKIQFCAQEIDFRTYSLCQLNLWMNGIYDANLSFSNALLDIPYQFPPADIALANFPFGLMFDTAKIKDLPYLSIPFEVNSTPFLDGNSLFLQRMLYQLGESGRAFAILPLHTTYKDRSDRRLREFLIRRDWLEAVISLPAGLLYNTGIPICIFCIHKQKSEARKNKILFINASNIEMEQKSRLYKTLHQEQLDYIGRIYHEFPFSDSELLKDNVEFISLEEIIANGYNLNPKQYASPIIKELRRLEADERLVPLHQVFEREPSYLWFDADSHAPKSVRFVTVQNLATSFGEYQLDLEQLPYTNDYPDLEGRLVKESALLINPDDTRLRLSYFEYKEEGIVVAKNIMVFTLDEEKINIEYLLLQLFSELFLQQLNAFKTDHLDSGMSPNEFARLQIVLPPRTSQDKEVRETKVRLLREEERKVEALRQRMNMGKQKAQSEQFKIISSLQHELGNRLPAVLSEFKNLQDYIYDKVAEQTPMQWNEPIFPVFEGEDISNIDTLEAVLKRIETLLHNSIHLLDDTGNIINADSTRLNLSYVNLKYFLLQIANLYNNENRFTVEVEVEDDEDGNELTICTYIDPHQMTTAFTNFIENAKRHGFIQDKKYIVRFRLGLSPDKQQVWIECENDGKPFPPDFSFEDFITYGNYAGETGHSGIGGFLINQIIENHNGTLIYKDNIEPSDPFKVQFEIILPYLKR